MYYCRGVGLLPEKSLLLSADIPPKSVVDIFFGDMTKLKSSKIGF